MTCLFCLLNKNMLDQLSQNRQHKKYKQINIYFRFNFAYICVYNIFIYNRTRAEPAILRGMNFVNDYFGN